MIDFESFENYLKQIVESNGFVHPDHLIKEEEIFKIRDLIKKFKSTDVLKCIKGFEKFFLVEIKCNKCNEILKKQLSTTKLRQYINNKINVICPSCEIEKEKIQHSKKHHQNYHQKISENTFYYIENYLNPNAIWLKETKQKDRINAIKDLIIHDDKIEEHIQSMEYQEFLKTPYWKAISSHVKYKAKYRCQLCNNTENLATHHRNYDIHGKEHLHMTELVALCEECHAKFHDIE